jgi:hypothetical protein
MTKFIRNNRALRHIHVKTAGGCRLHTRLSCCDICLAKGKIIDSFYSIKPDEIPDNSYLEGVPK